MGRYPVHLCLGPALGPPSPALVPGKGGSLLTDGPRLEVMDRLLSHRRALKGSMGPMGKSGGRGPRPRSGQALPRRNRRSQRARALWSRTAVAGPAAFPAARGMVWAQPPPAASSTPALAEHPAAAPPASRTPAVSLAAFLLTALTTAFLRRRRRTRPPDPVVCLSLAGDASRAGEALEVRCPFPRTLQRRLFPICGRSMQ